MVFILMMYLDYLSATYNPGELYAGAFFMDIVLLIAGWVLIDYIKNWER